MRSWVSLATSTLPFNTRETVETETPAVLATSWMVTARFLVVILGFGQIGIVIGIIAGIVTDKYIIAQEGRLVNKF